MGISLIATSKARHLVPFLNKSGKLQILSPEKNKDHKYHFPDGEIYVRLAKVHQLEKRVIVLHSGCPDPNAGLIELEMILQILNNHTSHRIEVFFSYFPYGQQDKMFSPGEINMAYTLLEKLVKNYNVKRIYAIDAHFVGRPWVENFPFVNISAVEKLKSVAEKEYPDLIYKTPDSGSQRRTGIKGVKKKRIHSYETRTKCSQSFKKDVQGKTVAVVDDILETGGTLDRFYDECKKYGAKKVIALITHGVMPSGIKRIEKKYDRLYLANTIQTAEKSVNISDLIINSI
ncbi:MAG: ribose-phosphate diphosphokinase [Patescibacteria group bacterium]|jgi:ribose-phosphate pyrophosphokinase